MIHVVQSHEVTTGGATGHPVVALESVIVAHGLPRPMNLKTARQVEADIRTEGAVPATLALRDGTLHVGLEDAQLEAIATDPSVEKVNLGNLGAVLARGGWGATTVASSLWGCRQAGLQVLVTGGIGGVHRGFSDTLDMSSDLAALARWPVAVVCSGVKSLLDVGATRERLETLGVPVLGWQTGTLPRFYIRDSEYSVDARVESAGEAARIARCHWEAGGAAILIGVPVPADEEIIEPALEEALVEAEYDRRHAPQPIEGRAVTPFLLERLHEYTHGATLKSNVALIRNNARVGAWMARALKDLQDTG